MDYFTLINNGLEQTAKEEIQEKLKINSIVTKNVLEFSSTHEPNLQSARRILLVVTKTRNIDNIYLKNLPAELFTNETKFKVAVEGVKGQEKRLEIAKKVSEGIYQQLKPTNPILEFKHPDFLVVVFYNGEDYFMGIDKQTLELNIRPYRVFPHSASFRGDLAFHLVKLSEYTPGKKLLVGFCKDGILAIEAARYSGELVYAFDESTMNVTAAKKNVKISKTYVEVKKGLLEDLDVLYDQAFFDICIFHVTTKDEAKLNEIYRQVKYTLKKNGVLMFIARPIWEVPISEAFDLIKTEEIKKGDGGYKVWVMKKY